MKLLDATWWKGLNKVIAISKTEDGWKVLLACKKGDEIIPLYQREGFSDSEIKNYLKERKELPVILHLENEFSIDKYISPISGTSPVSLALGNNMGKAEDYFSETFPAENGKLFCSIIRLENIEKVLNLPSLEGANIVAVTSSPALVSLLLPGEGSFSWKLNGRQWNLHNGSYTENRHPHSQEIDPGDLSVNLDLYQSHLLMFASVVKLILSQAFDPSFPLKDKLKEHTEISKMKRGASVYAAFLFLCALVLFSFRIKGEKEKEKYETEYMQNKSLYKELDQSREKLKEREGLASLMSQGGNSKASFYLDRLGPLVPQEISLTEIIQNPTDEESKGLRSSERRLVSVVEPSRSDRSWIIKGNSDVSFSISHFSEALESQNWVEKISVISSDLNFNSGVYEFIFLVEVKHV